MLPLVRGLPMRLTEHFHKPGGAFKHSKVILKDWELDRAEEERIQTIEDNEIRLEKQPIALHLYLETATKYLKTTGTEKTFRLPLVTKVWSRDSDNNARVRRKGFQIVPDFGGTAHAYCGESLEKSIGRFLFYRNAIYNSWGCRYGPKGKKLY